MSLLNIYSLTGDFSVTGMNKLTTYTIAIPTITATGFQRSKDWAVSSWLRNPEVDRLGAGPFSLWPFGRGSKGRKATQNNTWSLSLPSCHSLVHKNGWWSPEPPKCRECPVVRKAGVPMDSFQKHRKGTPGNMKTKMLGSCAHEDSQRPPLSSSSTTL